VLLEDFATVVVNKSSLDSARYPSTKTVNLSLKNRAPSDLSSRTKKSFLSRASGARTLQDTSRIHNRRKNGKHLSSNDSSASFLPPYTNHTTIWLRRQLPAILSTKVRTSFSAFSSCTNSSPAIWPQSANQFFSTILKKSIFYRYFFHTIISTNRKKKEST